MIIGKDTTFIQRELDMFFSDNGRFIKDVFDVSPVSGSKAIYNIALNQKYSRFSDDLTVEKVFKDIEQLVDDVQERIDVLLYHNWKDRVFCKDETFSTTYFESPKPLYIYKSDEPVGHLGKVLLCITADTVSIRNLEGQIFDKTVADINTLNDGIVCFRSLALSAMPEAFFKDNKEMNNHINSNENRVTELEHTVDGYTDSEDVYHEGFDDRISALEQTVDGDNNNGIASKVNEMYPRTVGDDSLLSQTYRKALRNQLDIYDLNREVNGYEDTEQDPSVHVDGIVDEIDALQSVTADHEIRITNNRNDIDYIKAYPEYNIAGIPPFYLLRRGDFSSVSNRAYDPVFFSDFPVADAQNVAWLHPCEQRVKDMPMRLLADSNLKASVDRLISEANQGTTGRKVEIGCYVGEYFFFAADPATWTTAATYTRKEIMTLVSFVPAKIGGGAYKPALMFEILTGHLDGGSAAGDCTGMFCLMDKSETTTPDYHWYRYGDNVNINGMALADVKVQYH